MPFESHAAEHWDSLDEAREGTLELAEAGALAEWIWRGFHPNETLSKETRRKEVNNDSLESVNDSREDDGSGEG
jgi:hypothetical protein